MTTYVTETLEALLADGSLIPSETDVKTALYKLFLAMWNSVGVNQEEALPPGLQGLDRNLEAISPGPGKPFSLRPSKN